MSAMSKLAKEGKTLHKKKMLETAEKAATKKKAAAGYIFQGRTYLPGETLPDGRKLIEVNDGVPVLSKAKDRGTTIVKTTPTSSATDKKLKEGQRPPIAPNKAIPFESSGLSPDFRKSVLRRQKAVARIEKWEKIKNEENDRIKLILTHNHFRSVLVDETFQVTMAEGRVSKKIDGLALMKQGVSADVIEKATIVSEGSPYPMVTDVTKPRKGKGE